MRLRKQSEKAKATTQRMSEVRSVVDFGFVFLVDERDEFLANEALESLAAAEFLRAGLGSQNPFPRYLDGADEIRTARKGEIPGTQPVAGSRRVTRIADRNQDERR